MLECNKCRYAVVGVIAVGAVGTYFARRYFKGGQFTENVSAKGKVAVITGANTGIGLETAKELHLRGAKVYMLCRNEQRATAAKEELVKAGCEISRLIYINCDLASMENIRQCAAKLVQSETHIDILINNAGLWTNGYQTTVDGHELTWGTNYLGPFLLTELLFPLLEKAPEGRIVNVASTAAFYSPPIDLEKIDDNVEGFSARAAYCKSKLANIMHARELTRRLQLQSVTKITTVTINSLHPGAIATEIFRDLGLMFKVSQYIFAFFMKSWKDGAQTSLYCALSTDLFGVSGQFFADCARKTEPPLALDFHACKELYNYSLKTVGLE